MTCQYIPAEQVVEIHKMTIRVSGGGADGIINMDYLESALEHIQNDDYYPSFEDKLTHLIFAANKFHAFQDGNKRISIALGANFLLLNGYTFILPRFIQEMENISYHVASGKIDEGLLKELLTAIIYESDYSEELKLKYFNAISDEHVS